ncbi:MAG: type I-U CRISPR-associated protein Csx17 [Armatimonadota bacterium]
MTEPLHEIALPGCTPVPLGHYLKALGVLRLVSEQADASARGWWEDDLFHLRSRLDVDALLEFFLKDYRPTPLVAPWNGGSGFYPKDKRTGFDALRSTNAPRLSLYRDAISLCFRALSRVGLSASPPGDKKKEDLLKVCRASLPDAIVTWLDAAFVLGNDGPSYPALLGTGGNDGRLEFTNNFMQRIAEVIVPESGQPAPRSGSQLQAALFDIAAHDRLGAKSGTKPVGQFLPGGAGGANAAAGYDGDAVTNPWDYILMLEGALVFSGSVARRRSESSPGLLSYPFAVRTTDAGYDTAAAGDVAKGRAETWLPLWQRPASYREVASLFAEGRASVGRRSARDGVDFARAVATLGVDRGISAFERFGYLQRNGRAYIAVPLERWRVPDRPSDSLRLLDEIDEWLGTLERVARRDTTPASIGRAVRRIKAAMMDVCRHDTPVHWQQVLMALGAAEEAMIRSPQTTVSTRLTPLPSLSFGWVPVCDDGSAEFRLALALASIGPQGEIGPLRANMVPLRDWRRYPRFNTQRMDDPAVVWGQGDLVSNMVAALQRRCMDAKRLGVGDLPLSGTRPARLDDIDVFIYGQVDEGRLEALLWGLNAVWTGERVPEEGRAAIPAGYALLKLVHLPRPLERSRGAAPVEVRYDPETTRLACAGRMMEATECAAHRLCVSGLPVAIAGVPETPELSRRIAAALLFPISDQAVEVLCDHVLLPSEEPQAV